jgi:hypothetical protein
MKYLPSSLVGIFTVTSLYAANAARTFAGDMLIPLLVAVLIGLFFTLLFSLNKWTAKSMPLIASVFTAVFLLWNIIPTWVCIVLLAASLVVGVKFNTRQAVKFIGIGAIFAIFITFGQMMIIGFQNIEIDASQQSTSITPQCKPNIYFIVPDRMPSFDAMWEANIDALDFGEQLTALGFYVKPDQVSRDPYLATDKEKLGTTRTMRYFASVLNDGREIPLATSYKDCKKLIQQPAIVKELHAQGYTFTNIESWFAETAGINADVSLAYSNPSIYDRIFSGEFNTAFWERTIIAGLNFRAFLPQGVITKTEQNRQIWQAQELDNLSTQGGQNFILAHILLPHEPFVWTRDGKAQTANKSDYDKYIEQIEFAQGYLGNIAAILRQNDPTAIIIIQSDEGMAFRDAEESKMLSPIEWNGVLTAWHIPGADQNDLSQLKHTEVLKYVVDNTP